MKKLASTFIAVLMVVGLTTSAFAAGSAGQGRGRDNHNYQTTSVRAGDNHREWYGHYNRYAGRWGHHDRYGHRGPYADRWQHHGPYAWR